MLRNEEEVITILNKLEDYCVTQLNYFENNNRHNKSNYADYDEIIFNVVLRKELYPLYQDLAYVNRIVAKLVIPRHKPLYIFNFWLFSSPMTYLNKILNSINTVRIDLLNEPNF